MTRPRTLTLALGLTAALTSVIGSGTAAQAALLTGSATNCTSAPQSQVFAPWQDSAYYDLIPGGAFESGDPSWSLSGGAASVAGNEPFAVHSASDSASLSLPSGSSATSPSFCVGIQNPSVRLFAVNNGNPNSTLGVSVNFVGPLGLQLSARIATISSNGTWAPTPVLPIVVNLLTLLPGNETPISLTVTPQGSGGQWQIDDAYVDPIARGG